MELLAVALVLLVLGGVAVLMRRQRERNALVESLDVVADRLQRPVPENLVSRKNQIARAIQSLSDQVRVGRAGRLEVEEALPRFMQQLNRLEHDASRLSQSLKALESLTAWIKKFTEVKPGSELADLRDVARNAYRITLGLQEEGSLDRAQEVAREADTLLTRQYEALQQSQQRLQELLKRLETQEAVARACNAPILARAGWERANMLRLELSVPLKEERPSDALVLATRLSSQLEHLLESLRTLLGKQLKGLQADVETLLHDLLLWPPGQELPRQQVERILKVIEENNLKTSPSLDEVKVMLESFQPMVEQARNLTRTHERVWTQHVQLLRQSLEGSTLQQRLKSFSSLPDPFLEAQQEVRRLRGRLELRESALSPWQVAESLQEVLDREAELTQRLNQLEQGLHAQLSRMQTELERLVRFASRVGLEPARIHRAEMLLRGLKVRLDRRDLSALEHEARACQEVLDRLREEGRARGLENARQVELSLRKALEKLEKEELSPYVREDYLRMKGTHEQLRQKLDLGEVLEALSLGEGWLEQAPALVLQAGWRRAEQRFDDQKARMGDPPELLGLLDPARSELEGELNILRQRLDLLREKAERPEQLEKSLAELQPDVNWLMLRIRKELTRRFQDAMQRHTELLERLGQSTVQFYLPEGAIQLLADGRRIHLQAQAASRTEGEALLEPLQVLLAHAIRLEEVWRESLPKARRFYERQLGALEVEVLEVELAGLPPSFRKRREKLLSTLEQTRESLKGPGWEEALAGIEPLSKAGRALSEQAERSRGIVRWWQSNESGLVRQVEQLRQSGCVGEASGLEQALQSLRQALEQESGGGLEEAERQVRQQVARGDAALQELVEAVARSREEQEQITRLELLLSGRKQDLDWLRSCLKDVLDQGVDGLNLKEGLNRIGAIKRSLDPMSLDLKAVESQDRAFRQWVAGVLSRAEQRFKQDFKPVLDSLHDQPTDIRSLCAEALAHVDAVLTAQTVEPDERRLYETLQKRGDAYHRLFSKRFSFK